MLKTCLFSPQSGDSEDPTIRNLVNAPGDLDDESLSDFISQIFDDGGGNSGSGGASVGLNGPGGGGYNSPEVTM